MATPPCNIDSQSKLTSWLLGWFADAPDHEKSVMVQAVYARDGRKISDPHEISQSVAAYVREWDDIHKKAVKSSSPRVQKAWEAPEEGWIKANSDGSVSKHREKGGGGAVLRDHEGAFRAAACHFFGASVNPEKVEIQACKRAIELARDIGAQKLHLESDSSCMMAMLNSPVKNLSAVGPLVEEIKEMLKSFLQYSHVGMS